jgi:hypothetical protein
MNFSLWNHNFTHTVEVSMSAFDAIRTLQAYFRDLRHRVLTATPELGALHVERGNYLFSTFIPGPETWCRHTITVMATDTSNGKSTVKFSINLKLMGFSVGKNFLLEECKKLGLSLQGQPA